jgi:isoleucyl-tRNA synthetase
MKRTPEVLDCWFESGSMPYAQGHYPFENRDAFEKGFPADFIAEGLDQTRGWFYTLTVLASALFAKPAFKNVIVNGILLSADGKKLSKRLKNYPPPEEIFEKTGADALRLFLINSPAVKAEDLRFSEEGVLEVCRSVLLPFWNAYAFFVTYANVDGFRPPPAGSVPTSANELDRWIVSLLNDVIDQVNAEMEAYNLYKVVPLLVDFIENLTNWYIRRSRRRFWKSEDDADKGEAYATLYYVLTEFAKVMAPSLPFMSEAIYRNLAAGAAAGPQVSVHLQLYPQARQALIDRDLEAKMRMVRQAVAMGRALRSRYSIKTRQPLAEFVLVVKNEERRRLLSAMEQLITDELNVKKVTFSSREEDVVTRSAKANFKKLGKLFGARMKEAAAEIEKLTPAQIDALEHGDSVELLGQRLTLEDIDIRRTKREGVEVETEGDLTAALNTQVTPELKAEGLAREFVNRVQNIRKTSGFEVTDRISIVCVCPADLRQALERHREYVCAETLTLALTFAPQLSAPGAEAVEIDDIHAQLSVTRAGTHA